MRYHRLKIISCHQGHFWRCSQPKAVIHPVGGKILKAISNTGMEADGETAQYPASLSKNIYCQDIVLVARTSGKEGNRVRRKVGDRTDKNAGLLMFFRKLMLMQLFTYSTDMYWISIMCQTLCIALEIEWWKNKIWSLALWISPTNRMWNSQDRESLGGCREKERKNICFWVLYSS